MRRFKFYVAASWKTALILVGVLAVVFLLFFYKLESLTPSYSAAEQKTVGHLVMRDFGLKKVMENPVYLPYQLGTYLLEKLHVRGVYAARALSATAGMLSVICFYYIISRWHTKRIALLGTLLFMTSSWLLHTARLATPEASFLLVLALTACGAWLNETSRRGLKPLMLGVAISGLLLYIPGMAWFVLAGIIWQRRKVLTELKKLSVVELLIMSGLGLLLLSPMITGSMHDPSLLLTILGLPASLPSVQELLSNASNVPRQLFVQGPADPTRWVGTMPLLDIFAAAMFFVGLYSYRGRLRLDRTKLLLLGLLAGVVLVALGATSIAILLPFIYLVVAAGITYLLKLWLDVFPRNPLARGIGSSLITIAVLLSAFYNLSHYFVAWANAPATRETFSRRI